MTRLNREFFDRDVLTVAPELLGKKLAINNGEMIKRYTITEVEAYRGEEDLACHASKGRTARTEIMYHHGGFIYVYFIYGMHWMLNFVTGINNNPQAVLIRGIEGFNGPGKLTKHLAIDASFYGEYLCKSKRIWVEDQKIIPKYTVTSRIGINYAGEPWMSKPWRFVVIPT
jgi:DNA-3-methyladenine glycosylase